jgi:hypothetical protein
MFPEAALHMLFAGQLPHASDLTMATFALVSDVETTMAVSFSMLHTSFFQPVHVSNGLPIDEHRPCQIIMSSVIFLTSCY